MAKKFYELQPNDEVAENADITGTLSPYAIDLASWQDLTIANAEESIADMVANDTNHVKTVGLAPAFAEQSYAAGDFCSYGGKCYLCKLGYTATAASATPDLDTDHWQLANLSTLFSGDNTSLTTAINSAIATRCASLDPAKSSIADIINALKGNN